MKCTRIEKVSHVPEESIIVIDPETKKRFKRIYCKDCGQWLGDEFIKE
jgi:hypothetical protein